MVGAIADRSPLAGWICAPEYEALYYGGPELGLWQIQGNQSPKVLHPDRLTTSTQVILGFKDQQQYGARLRAAMPTLQFEAKPGSFGLKVLQVLQGQASMYVYFNGRVKVWDTVAPIALAKAAGMMCCDLEGKPIRYSPDSLNSETLAHLQPIIIGWQPMVETWLPQMRSIITATLLR